MTNGNNYNNNGNNEETKMVRKTTQWRFKRLISDISHEKTWKWQRKGNLVRETESLLTAAQNNAIRTSQIKSRIDKTQQNSKFRLCRDRDETINHIISEFSKLARENKTNLEWVGKVIHWKMCSTHNRSGDETHKLIWDFEIQTNHLIYARNQTL